MTPTPTPTSVLPSEPSTGDVDIEWSDDIMQDEMACFRLLLLRKAVIFLAEKVNCYLRTNEILESADNAEGLWQILLSVYYEEMFDSAINKAVEYL